MPDQGLALVALTGIIGGGAVSYFATASTLSGGVFETTKATEARPPAAAYVLGAAGVWLTLAAYGEVAEDVGWTPLVLGSAAILGLGLIARR